MLRLNFFRWADKPAMNRKWLAFLASHFFIRLDKRYSLPFPETLFMLS
jgi:hypothetical protein